MYNDKLLKYNKYISHYLHLEMFVIEPLKMAFCNKSCSNTRLEITSIEICS